MFSIMFIFLTLQLPFKKGGLQLNWWGNEVFIKSECCLPALDLTILIITPTALDANPSAYLVLEPGQAFDRAPGASA